MNAVFKKYIVVILVAVTVLWSCSANRNYTRPDLKLPENYSAQTTGDSSLALQNWKVFFKDAKLVALIDKALTNNFDYQQALKRVEVYQSLAKQAKVGWLPALSAQASASTVNPSGNSLNGISLSSFLKTNHIEDYSVSATLSWEIDVWGKIKNRKEAAMADYLQSYEATRAVQTSVIAAVADAYFTLQMFDAQLIIAERNVALSDSTTTIMSLQKSAGQVTSLAVQQAQAQAQTAKLLRAQLLQSIQLQENGLRLLLGDYPGTIDREVYDNALLDSVYATGVPAALLSLRPDVRASEQALLAANARVGVAQANRYPSLTLSASGGLNAFEASDWFSVPTSVFGLASGTLLQPIFERRALRTQYEIAKTQREQSVIAFRQAVTVGVHDVTNALVKLKGTADQRTFAHDRVNGLETAVSNAQLLFKSGMADYLEVITAQSRALSASIEESIIIRQQRSAQVELYRALGGGWK
ncbi:efflux transporter outer membrane subunit [Pseudochryseolinea flava]|uniref:TolC family protein n=1 Tax=Pseudochryseolinea flava TaxID=2059302 RepID=A0A364Y180_9BACT|nr:efflux transporter outer membrane subunit [Pseudochryseolinea flava]RAW00459.1 TolC family protein [Pseudochryseolinea flava]